MLVHSSVALVVVAYQQKQSDQENPTHNALALHSLRRHYSFISATSYIVNYHYNTGITRNHNWLIINTEQKTASKPETMFKR